MMKELASAGLGLLTDVFFTENIVNKLSAFNDKKSVEQFVNTIKEWEIEFEQQHDGTIATSSAFFAFIKYNNVIERIISFVISPSFDANSEKDFLDKLYNQMVVDIEQKKGHKLSFEDHDVINSFLNGVLSASKAFIYERISLNDRGLLYIAIQVNAQIRELKATMQGNLSVDEVETVLQNSPAIKDIKCEIIKNHQLTIEKIEELQRQILTATKENETANSIKEKLITWNNRQIKNLGDRYLPEINIPVGLENALNGLSLSEAFAESFLSRMDDFLIEMRKSYISELVPYIDQLSEYAASINFFNLTAEVLSPIKEILSKMDSVLDEKIKSNTESNKQYDLYRATNRVAAVRDYLEGSDVSAAICPYVILTGDGGTGKSHLIADHIQQQENTGNTNLLLLGQQFNGEDPLSILPSLLGTQNTYQELFQVFENIACIQHNRFLICIDALNEGAGVKFWNQTLGGLLEFIKGYPHIGLLISIRSQYEEQLFDEHAELLQQFVRIEHYGFARVMYNAIQRYFDFYGITTDALTILNNEFTNPLFLRLFCVAHRDTKISIADLSLPSVYEKYIEHIEKVISKRCGYNQAIKLINKIINCLINERMNQSKTAIRLPLETVIMTITECCKQWNISQDVYSALLAEGVLTQGVNFHGEEFVHITYERLEDYFVASRIVDAYDKLSNEEFIKQYDWILRKPDLLQFVWIVFAERKVIELNSVFPVSEERNGVNQRNAFLYSLLWRKESTISDDTIEYINSEILRYEYSFKLFIDALFALSTRPQNRLNGINSYHFFEKLSMPDRDATFIPVFDELYRDSDSALCRLLEWGLYYARQNPPDSSTAELASTVLCWLLISPNNAIRDKTTKALVSILSLYPDALISVMKRFESFDDPYILERIYAVAFGCAVNIGNKDKLSALASYVYTAIFDKDEVYPNILLRTYAKNIIDYAIHQGAIADADHLIVKIQPPYRSSFPEIPSDAEIKEYSLDTSSPDFQKHHYAQKTILSSMKVEYSRDGEPGGYGDFGRYTFQNYFSAWPNLHPMDLKNIAIKRIFELGYDVEKHGRYDCMVRRSYGEKSERIGKKYQWISLYELAARVSDNFPLKVYIDDFSDDTRETYCGSYYPNIRNIDPTVLVQPSKHHTSVQHNKYRFPDVSYDKWLEDFNDAPTFESCMRLEHNGRKFILLNGTYNWLDRKKLGFETYDLPRKNMWHQIRGYIVKRDSVGELLECLNGLDFMGRWMPEAGEDSEIYNKEFYWSDAYSFLRNPYYGNSEWVPFNPFRHKISFSEKILLPVRLYFSERKGDTIMNEDGARLSWFKICEDIFTTLHLQYGKDDNSCMYDTQGNLICFDSSEVLGEDIGYFIDEEQLCKYLDEKKLSLIWTSLSEKRVIGAERKTIPLPKKAIHYSAVYRLVNGDVEQVCGKQFVDKLYSR